MSQSIELARLDKHYGSFHAVRAIDLDIAAGEFVAIMGPSGCGKSTTLRLIAGLEAPSSGDIRIGGASMIGVPAHERRTPMVWQSLALFPFLSVADNVAFPLRMQSVSSKERRKRALEWLDRLGLAGMADRSIDQLSGGQRQRVAIARALITQPSILLLDEPLSALDAHLRVRMQTELSRLHRELGITFVYVTHAQSEAFALADRVVVMNEGQIQQTGKPQHVYRAPANGFVADFIGMNNRLDGQARGADQVWRHIQTAAGMFRLPAFSGNMEKVSFVIAADRIALDAPDAMNSPDRDSVEGTLLGTEFVGSTQTLFLETANGQEFKVQKQQHEVEALDLAPGRKLRLSWNPNHAWRLPG